mgnify:CR=1 FL=1
MGRIKIILRTLALWAQVPEHTLSAFGIDTQTWEELQ